MSGEKNEIIFEQAQELYANRLNKKKRSFDIGDFDISFARGLSLNDGARTLTDFTASILGEELSENIFEQNKNIKNIILCGGGRKNMTLVKHLKKLLKYNIKLIDDYNVDGDFIESQAFAYLSIRSFLKKPISYPSTTNVLEPLTGGEIKINY